MLNLDRLLFINEMRKQAMLEELLVKYAKGGGDKQIVHALESVFGFAKQKGVADLGPLGEEHAAKLLGFFQKGDKDSFMRHMGEVLDDIKHPELLNALGINGKRRALTPAVTKKFKNYLWNNMDTVAQEVKATGGDDVTIAKKLVTDVGLKEAPNVQKRLEELKQKTTDLGIDRLNAKIDTLTKEKEVLTDLHSKTKQQLKNVKSQFRAGEKTAGDAKEEIAILNNSLKETEGKFNALDMEHKTLLNNNKELTSRHQALSTDYKKLKRDNLDLNNDKEKMFNDYTALDDKYKGLNKSYLRNSIAATAAVPTAYALGIHQTPEQEAQKQAALLNLYLRYYN